MLRSLLSPFMLFLSICVGIHAGKSYIDPVIPSAEDGKVPWVGEVSAGYQRQSGNVDRYQVNYFAKLDRNTPSEGYHLELGGRSGNDSPTVRNEAGNLRTRYCIKHKNGTWQFSELKLDYNRPLGIDLHGNLSIGTGWDLQKTAEEYLLLSVGIGADRLERLNGNQTRFSTAVLVMDFKQNFFEDNYLEGNLNL